VSPKKSPFYFWNNSSKKYTDFTNFWYTDYVENLTLANYKYAHFTWKMSPHYLVKCNKVTFWSTTQEHTVPVTWSNLCTARCQSSSVLTCGQPTAVIWSWWTTASVAWCRSECTRLQSMMWSSYDSGQLRHGVSSSRVWWMMPLTSGEQDSNLVFISNSICDVCGTIFPHHSIIGSFQRHPTTGSFQSHPLFPEETVQTFD